MDFATVIGLIIAGGTVGGAYMLEGGSFSSIFLTAPLMIVVGGTIGATIITTSMQTVRQVPRYLKLALFGRDYSFKGAIDSIFRLAEKARREGILGLENDMRQINDPFYRKAVRLLIDGTEVTALRGILETEMTYIEERHKRGIILFQKAGGFAPTLGILGTVLGLVHALGDTSDAQKMATSIAAAFIATLWGVGLANLFFLPISDKLRMRNDEEISYLELITEGVVAIQSGDSPRNIRSRLISYIDPRHRSSEY